MRMNNRRLTAAVAALAALSISTASIQAFAAADTATTNATISLPIGIANTADLDFGIIVPDAGAISTVLIDAAGARTIGIGVPTLIAGGTIGAASFDVTGDATRAYFITGLPGGSITLTSGGDNMTVDTFVLTAGPYALDGTGADTFAIGATLNIGIAQNPGNYTNAAGLTVTVNY